jgi:hypothetical protein
MAKDLALFLNVQTGSAINPAPCSMAVGVLSAAMNHLGSEVDHCPPYSAKVKNEWRSTYTPSVCLHDVGRDNFTVTNS